MWATLELSGFGLEFGTPFTLDGIVASVPPAHPIDAREALQAATFNK